MRIEDRFRLDDEFRLIPVPRDENPPDRRVIPLRLEPGRRDVGRRIERPTLERDDRLMPERDEREIPERDRLIPRDDRERLIPEEPRLERENPDRLDRERLMPRDDLDRLIPREERDLLTPREERERLTLRDDERERLMPLERLRDCASAVSTHENAAVANNAQMKRNLIVAMTLPPRSRFG